MKRPRNGELTRETILKTAEDFFARQGYAATTLDHVADSVGIRRPSLLYYFPDKYALYRAVLTRQYEHQEAFLAQRKREEFADIVEYVNYLIDCCVDYYCENTATVRLNVFNLLSDENEIVNPRELAVGSVNFWRSAIAEGVAAGVFRNVPAAQLFALLGGMVSFYLLIPDSVGLIDRKLAYAAHNKRNINKMRENLRNAIWGMLRAD